MIGIDFTFAQIEAQISSFWSIPVVAPLLAAPIAVGIVVLISQSLRDIFNA